uniref:Secreted protein n=1 Tax=Meloidogyne hapla TaxID=6305 RepID=A0A1I8BYD3_MELHA
MEGITINRSDRSSPNKICHSSTPSFDCLNNKHFHSTNPSLFPMAFPFRATTVLFILLSVMLIMSFQHQAQAASLSIPVAQLIGESGLFERDDRDYRPLQEHCLMRTAEAAFGVLKTLLNELFFPIPSENNVTSVVNKMNEEIKISSKNVLKKLFRIILAFYS